LFVAYEDDAPTATVDTVGGCFLGSLAVSCLIFGAAFYKVALYLEACWFASSPYKLLVRGIDAARMSCLRKLDAFLWLCGFDFTGLNTMLWVYASMDLMAQVASIEPFLLYLATRVDCDSGSFKEDKALSTMVSIIGILAERTKTPLSVVQLRAIEFAPNVRAESRERYLQRLTILLQCLVDSRRST
jgi:hypothetical protein